MIRSIETTGKTKELAIRAALEQLKLTEDDEAGDEVEDFVPVEAALADSLLQAASNQYTKPDEGQGTDE